MRLPQLRPAYTSTEGKVELKARHAAALALVGLVLAVAILIYALRPRYYLIVSFSNQLVQLGPFDTQTGCESVRQRMPEIVSGSPSPEKNFSDTLTALMRCVPSR